MLAVGSPEESPEGELTVHHGDAVGEVELRQLPADVVEDHVARKDHARPDELNERVVGYAIDEPPHEVLEQAACTCASTEATPLALGLLLLDIVLGLSVAR